MKFNVKGKIINSEEIIDDICNKQGQLISEETVQLSEDEFFELTLELIKQNSGGFELIKQKIQNFLKKLEEYDKPALKGQPSLEMSIKNLELKKEFIYKDFFEIQNLINNFIGQDIVMTYVHIDDEGRREIRISENNIEHLAITTSTSWNGKEFAKMSYVVENNYQKLENALPQKENESLQTTARTAEQRYRAHKKRIMWEWEPTIWKGYKLSNMGPINEAYVNMYVHNVKLLGTLEHNIDTFMTDDQYGARKADATRGFLIGDVSKFGKQYAVKGAFGSPQGTKEVIKSFKDLQNNSFSEEAFAKLIKQYTYDELHRNYKPQIGNELSQKTIRGVLNYLRRTGNSI